MICLVQPLMLTLPDVPFGQLMADTPSWAFLKVGLYKKMSVVAWSVPVEPRSTSASPAPKTLLPGCCSPASMMPWKAGVEPNGPVHRFVPNWPGAGLNNHCSPTMAIAPLAPIEISGSLFPSGRVRVVLEKLRLPAVVAALAPGTRDTTSVRITDPDPSRMRSGIDIDSSSAV